MSDESDDKTEDPTPHRLEKAREEGQIPRHLPVPEALDFINEKPTHE